MADVEWVQRGMTKVAIPGVESAEPTKETRELTPRDVARMIACPTCHARVDQMCHTATGHHREPHATRLIPKRCPCGELVEAGKKVCEDCRALARRENGRRGMQATRARRRAAKEAA
jgi:hypothetical protein